MSIMGKKQERYFYTAVFNYDDNEISVIFPDFDVATSGVDEDDALLSARELLGITIFGYEEDGQPLPAPTQLSAVECEPGERAVLIDVYMPSVRNANINKSVNRTVTLPAWLNSVALEHNINFSQILQDAIKQQLHLN